MRFVTGHIYLPETWNFIIYNYQLQKKEEKANELMVNFILIVFALIEQNINIGLKKIPGEKDVIINHEWNENVFVV